MPKRQWNSADALTRLYARGESHQHSIAELAALFCTGGKSALWAVRAMETHIVQWKGSPVQWKGQGVQWKGLSGAMESWFSQRLLLAFKARCSASLPT